MIPRRYIIEWKEHALWPNDGQVEQDLVIERALVQLFSDPLLKEQLAFRGGTALHKIFIKPQARYSEDIDLVQIAKGPIGPILDAIRKQHKYLGAKGRFRVSGNMNTIIYRFESEMPPVINLQLKIKINCREHFTVFGYHEIKHSLKNGWFSGSCGISSYLLEEMLSTKLRALYQRRKGRDLFDVYYALTNMDVDTNKVLEAYRKYMAFSVDQPPLQKEFLQNMEQKEEDPAFGGDIYALLRPGIEYDQQTAFELVRTEIIEKI